MSPPLLATTDAGTATDARETVKALVRGPAPEYKPFRNPGDVPADSPRWRELTDARQLAWDRGIPPDELESYEQGACHNQVTNQLALLNRWNEEHAPGAAAPAA